MNNTIIKYTFITIAIIAIIFLIQKLSNYDGRMEKYNRYMCANYGYEADCKTPLPQERRLK